jgi:pimeloyl-ACP methyl ester carboxylesterase
VDLRDQGSDARPRRLSLLAPRGRRRAAPRYAPEPPVELPPGYVVHVKDRGELFVRDSGGDGPVALLLHGWMVSADLNWFPTYQPLVDAGYRVLALDHRGHGRGLRTPQRFTLERCAQDAAALLETLGCEPVVAVGYSMGGPIAQLLARNHPERVRALVLGATSREWRSPRMRITWNLMALLRLVLGLFPNEFWRAGLRAVGFPDSATTTWYASELTRGSARDMAEAGRELGRFDSREWIGTLRVPAAVIVTARDRDVPPRKQRALAASLDAPVFEFQGDHAAVTAKGAPFARMLVEAVRSLEPASAREERVPA